MKEKKIDRIVGLRLAEGNPLFKSMSKYGDFYERVYAVKTPKVIVWRATFSRRL